MLKPVTFIYCASIFFGLIMFASSLPSWLEHEIHVTRVALDEEIALRIDESYKILKLLESEEYKALVGRLERTRAAAPTAAIQQYHEMWRHLPRLSSTDPRMECAPMYQQYGTEVKEIIAQLSNSTIKAHEDARQELLSELDAFNLKRKIVDAIEDRASSEGLHLTQLQIEKIQNVLEDIRTYIRRNSRPKFTHHGLIASFDHQFKEGEEKITQMATDLQQSFFTCDIQKSVPAVKLYLFQNQGIL